MSELKVDKVSPRTGTYVSLNTVGSKNIIINGDMSIAQRGTSVNVGNNDNGYHTCDRWSFFESGSPTAVFTMSQSTDVPTGQGFATSLKMDCATAQGSLGASDLLRIEQRFEGQNLQYLKKGTSSAESLTMSFWVKSNKTGTYIAELNDSDNGRQISKSYTIDSASTWEKKTLTFEGDTTGTIDNDNALSLVARWWLAAGTNFTSGTLATSWQANDNADRAVGQVNLADNTANEWYVTGVQLEAGTTASDFEFLPYDMNLDRCYRYYQMVADGTSDVQVISNAVSYTTTTAYGVLSFIKEMRSAPSLDQTSGTGYYNYSNVGNSDTFDSFVIAQPNTRNARLNNGDTIAITVGQSGWFSARTTGGKIALDSEL